MTGSAWPPPPQPHVVPSAAPQNESSSSCGTPLESAQQDSGYLDEDEYDSDTAGSGNGAISRWGASSSALRR